MSFNETLHTRAHNGTFTEKAQTAPEVSLTEDKPERFDLTGILMDWIPGENADNDAAINRAVDAFWRTPDVHFGSEEAQSLDLDLWVPSQDASSDAIIRDELMYRLEVEPFTLSPYGLDSYGASTDSLHWERNTSAETGDGYAGTATSKDDFDMLLDESEDRADAWAQKTAENAGLFEVLGDEAYDDTSDELVQELLNHHVVKADDVLRVLNSAYKGGLTGDSSVALEAGLVPEQHIPDIVTRMVVSAKTRGRFGSYDHMANDDPSVDPNAELHAALTEKRLTGGDLIDLIADAGAAGVRTRIGLTPNFERIYS